MQFVELALVFYYSDFSSWVNVLQNQNRNSIKVQGDCRKHGDPPA